MKSNDKVDQLLLTPIAKDFNIIGKIYRDNTFKQKVTESLLIKDTRPTLKTQEICATTVIQLIWCFSVPLTQE